MHRLPTRAYLALGSNLGDRCANLKCARDQLGQTLALASKSSVYETEAVGAVEQPDFLNQVVAIDTELAPFELLDLCETIERELGRSQKGTGAARPIDIDILLYGDKVLRTDRLVVPHPRLNQRRFVLTPLADIASELCVPGLNATVSELLLRCQDLSRVVKRNS
ncbi:MAG: 2-amino-4-hydroxy-6-hydroxymethyldihydropteridine diphosphokinase [Acidobacteriota bacterium]